MKNLAKLFLITICILFGAGCSLVSGNVGTIAGRVTIGPLQPVHREGEIVPTPSPEVYAAWQIVIYTTDMQREIARTEINAEGYYQIVLPVSFYSVTAEPVKNNGGPGGSDVHPIEITKDEVTYLNLDIDTGIR